MKLLAILLLMALAAANGYPQDDMIRACGADLSRRLMAACLHEYYDINHSRTSRESPNNPDNNNEQTGEDRSIVSECCMKACHFKDFISYCPKP